MEIDTVATLIANLTCHGGRVIEAHAARILASFPVGSRTAILDRFSSLQRERLAASLRRLDTGPLAGLSVSQAVQHLVELPGARGAQALARSAPDFAVAVLKALDPGVAAGFLIAIAKSEPRLAADLLSGMDEPILVDFRSDEEDRCPHWVPQARAAASVVSALDLTHPPVVSMLRLLPDTTVTALLERLEPADRQQLLDAISQQQPRARKVTKGLGSKRIGFQ